MLRPTDPEPLETTLAMARAGEAFAIELAGDGVPAERELDVIHGVGKIRGAWSADGGFEAAVAHPSLGLATRVRGHLVTEDGRPVLRGRATNRTHVLWCAVLAPCVTLFAVLALVAGLEDGWWPAVLLTLVAGGLLALAVRLTTARSPADTRALDLFAIAGVLWAAVEDPMVTDSTRPVTEADRELLRRAMAAVTACDAADWEQLLREWEREDELANGFSADAPPLEVKPVAFALFLEEAAAQDAVEPETLELAQQLVTRFGR